MKFLRYFASSIIRMNSHMQKTIFITAIVCIFIGCTSYNSNKVNTELIQGKWQLVDIEHFSHQYDTLSIDYLEEITFLVFDGDKCTQYMPDLGDTLNLTFSILDYKLMLYKGEVCINKLNIDSLTSERLVLSQEDSEHIYTKIRQ